MKPRPIGGDGLIGVAVEKVTLPGPSARQRDAKCASGGAQFLIGRRKWKPDPVHQFEACRVVDCGPKSRGQLGSD
ncbi:MAG: hypothetical protein IPJ27_02055 [Candidatus Accumulibacter sp.]|uniref:Uncharacterized protein n=1 Tax=Candidatus Accumulibacter proximus TaxID=2954385 RepID=A0A935PWC4_9PROT|nr:hypothetical protein [Candidatus Accumulibacter proximus]